jgi:hypothetical protein
MNNKILISFLTLMVILVAVYLTISTLYETSNENSYGMRSLTPPVSFNQIKASRPQMRGSSSAYQMESINMQTPVSSMAPTSQSSRNQIGVIGGNIGSINRSSRLVTGSMQSAPSSSSGIGVISKPIRRSSEGGFSNTLFPGASGKTSNRNSAAYSSGSMAINGTKSSTPSSYVPFSEGGTTGAPDPGGNADDECEDDIVFIPVPDGLPFLIFLSIAYALFIFVRVKRNNQRLSEKTLQKSFLEIEKT